MLRLPRRHLLSLLLAALPLATMAAPPKGGAANLAMIGEPQSLDPMASTADLVGTIMQHVYETLYTFDSKWNAIPMLADGMPRVSADGLTYSINIRKGVKLHSGRDLDAQDVVASLKRWMDMAPRGKSIGKDTADRIKGEIRQRISGDRNANKERRPAKLLCPWPNDGEEGEVIDKGEEDGNVDGGAVPSGERCGGHGVSIAYLC